MRGAEVTIHLEQRCVRAEGESHSVTQEKATTLGLRMKQRGVFLLKAPLLPFSPGDHCTPPEATVGARDSGYTESVPTLWEALGY